MARSRGEKILNLQFPTGGLNRRFGFQNQPPYTTPDCMNVRPMNHLGYRTRGGSRPGIGPAFRETLGSGNPVNMLSLVDVVEHDGRAFWQDTFEGTSLGGVWAQSAHVAASPSVSSRTARSLYATGATGITRSAFSPTIATGADYVVEMFIAPYQGQHWGTYSIFIRMDNTTPNVATDGVQCKLTMTGSSGAFSGSLLVNGTTTYNFTSGNDGYAAAGWFTVRISGNNVSAYWRNSTLISGQAVGAHTGQRVGFGLNATVSGGVCICDRFRVQYYRTGQTQNNQRRVLMAASNGSLYKETELGSMAAISSSLTLSTDTTLTAAQHEQKLFIADYGDWKVSGTGNGARGTANTKFDSSAIADWTTYGIDTDDDVLVIYGSSNTTTLLEGVYKISSVASGELTLTTSCATAVGATCNWFITRGPKVYDHSAGTLSMWTATSGYGSVPAGCPIVCLYRDRLVLAGGADGPQLLYMSRQGDAYDWDYTAEDVGRAVSLTANPQAGVPGEPITALIPHADQCLIIGCSSTLWILRGDPAYGGSIDSLSRRVGVLDKRSWCYVPSNDGSEGLIVFMSRDGLYMIPAGCQSTSPVPLSREKLPDELLDLDVNLYEVSMAYDQRDQGIHLCVTSRSSGNTTHWFVDWNTKGFFPFTLQTTQDPYTMFEYSSWCSEDSCVVFGCRDGKLRRFQKYHDRDDGANAITSYVDIGPQVWGDSANWTNGVAAEVVGEIATDSAAVDFAVRGGTSPEEAYNASAQYSATWDRGGMNYSHHPRVAGSSGFIKLSNNANRPWMMESVRVRVQPMGRNQL